MSATLFTLLCLLPFLLLSNAFGGLFASAEDGLDRFDQVMKMLMEYTKAPGAQLAVAKGGQLKYFKAFGVANRETGEALTTNHVIRYGSISKVFAGTAILKLVQEGRLNLEDKAFSFVENLHPPKGAVVDQRLHNITIRNLLQHTGGWSRTQNGLDAASFDVALYASQSLQRPTPATADETIQFMKGIPLSFDPGSAMEYANTGYLVLGRVIENVTGMSYMQYLQKHILRPRGIRGVMLGQSQLQHLAPNEVRYYGTDGEDIPWVSLFPGEGFVNQSYGSFDMRSLDSFGGLIGNAGDILRFVDHIDGLRQPAILRKEMVYEMLNAPMPEKREWKGDVLWDHSRGLDVFVSVNGKGNITSFQHNGALPGSRSYFMRLVKEKITFAVLLNTIPSAADFDYLAAGNLSEVARSIVQWPKIDLPAS